MNGGVGSGKSLLLLLDCWRWLEPDQKTGGQVAEEVTLEQFVQVLPPGGKEWVQRHRPKTLAEAVSLTEDYLAAEKPGVSSRRTDAPYKRDVGARREHFNLTLSEPPPTTSPVLHGIFALRTPLRSPALSPWDGALCIKAPGATAKTRGVRSRKPEASPGKAAAILRPGGEGSYLQPRRSCPIPPPLMRVQTASQMARVL
uniref:SCAN box domain-containing protein n=1 Tax=Pelusios castaneus TaxID=367368 RepID=A0A8C8RYI0_9SAUR